MAQAKQRDLAEVVGKRVDVEAAEGLELRVRGAARADEVRVVGIREPVRVGARRGEHCLLFQPSTRSTAPQPRARPRSPRFPSRRRWRARRAPERAARRRDAVRARRGSGAFRLGGADLEVRVSRPAERARAEQRAAEVGSRAAAPGDDALLGAAERTMGAVENAGAMQRRVRLLGALDVELVARRLVERAARVGADLGRDPEERRSANARRATVELETSRWTSTLPRPRRCARPATWKRPESSASRSHSLRRRDRGELFPKIVREQGVAFEREKAAFVADAVGAVGAEPVRGDDAVAGDEEAEVAASAEAAGRASGARRAGERRELAVGDDLPARDRAQRLGTAREKRRLVVEIDGHVLERHALAREVRLQQPHDFRHEASALA